MKLKYRFEIMDIDDEKIAVPIQNDTHTLSGVIKLNKTAAEIMELLNEEHTEEDVVTQLVSKYSASSIEEIRVYVHEFVSELLNEGLLL